MHDGARYCRAAGDSSPLRAYATSFLSGEPQQYVGAESAGETGLFLAGTDVLATFRPLLGTLGCRPGVNPSIMQPGESDLINKTAYDSLRAFRAMFVEILEITFYVVAPAIVIAVVVTEVHEGGSITSAMFTGRKILTKEPPDAAMSKPLAGAVLAPCDG
jgi:Ni/Fe-hydrogenase 1 B-type cytochrome subunit